MIYALNGVILAALFIFIGIRLLRKLNHHYEDIYEEQKASVSISCEFLDKIWTDHSITFFDSDICPIRLLRSVH